jgi:hypothetical protein
MDIDQSSRKAVVSGHRAKGTTWDKAWEFSEEQAADLKRCIQLRSAVEQECTEIVQVLDELGIECRRLKGASSDNAYLRRKLVQQERPVLKQGTSAQKRPEMKKSDWQPQMSKVSKLFGEASRTNINTRRMQPAYEKATQRPSKPRLESSKVVIDDATMPVYTDARTAERMIIPRLDLRNLALMLTNPSLPAACEKNEHGSACSTAYDDSEEENGMSDCDWVPLMTPRGPR